MSELGGLGSYGLYGYSADRIRQTVSDVRGKTGRPFALNLWLPTDDGAQDINVPESDGSAAALRPIFDELGLPLPARPDQYLPSFEEQI